MKKLVLAAFAAALLPTLAFAQGTLNFGTTATTSQYFTVDGGGRAPAGTFAYLWWSVDNVLPYTRISTNTVTVNGWLTTAITATTGTATPAGSSAWFYVSGLTTGGGTGRSPNFQVTTGNPGGNPPTSPATLDGWNAPILLTIPEPSTFALAGLGAAALLLFRRRK